MSDAVLAAMIAASATVFTSLLQLKSSLTKELATRTQTARRKGRAPFMLLLVMLVASAVGGFTIAQWFRERERAEHLELRQELQARITELSHTAAQLEQTRIQARTEIESEVLRRLGSEGAVALATIAPCKPVPAVGVAPPVTTDLAHAPVCTEADAIEVMLCATTPAAATIAAVELYARFADSDAAWDHSRAVAGRELEQARFSEKAVEIAGTEGTKHICHGFANWSSERARLARMVVRYSP